MWLDADDSASKVATTGVQPVGVVPNPPPEAREVAGIRHRSPGSHAAGWEGSGTTWVVSEAVDIAGRPVQRTVGSLVMTGAPRSSTANRCQSESVPARDRVRLTDVPAAPAPVVALAEQPPEKVDTDCWLVTVVLAPAAKDDVS